MRERIEQRLACGDVLLVDGAMGTLLQARGLQPGECPEHWCLTRPDDVRDVHRQYGAAGCDIVECNSFGASASKLDHFGLAPRAAEINRAAAALAREVAGDRRYVLGSMGPTGLFLEPYGDVPAAQLDAVFREQASALAAGGADALIVETMTAIEECVVAIRAARAVTSLTVIASFTFDPLADGGYASMMGVTPADFARQAVAAGAHIIGSNCGLGAEHMVAIVRQLRAAVPGVPLLAMPNAGMPVIEQGRTVFKESPEMMASLTPRLLAAGAALVGGCCGTTPAHIAAMRRVLDQSSL